MELNNNDKMMVRTADRDHNNQHGTSSKSQQGLHSFLSMNSTHSLNTAPPPPPTSAIIIKSMKVYITS